MDMLHNFERLAEKARHDAAPDVNVSSAALRDIRRALARRNAAGPLLVFSGMSVAAASVALVWAIQSWNALTDPLSNLFNALTMVIL